MMTPHRKVRGFTFSRYAFILYVSIPRFCPLTWSSLKGARRNEKNMAG